MKKANNRAPKSIGAILLKEVPYKSEWRVQATWKDPPALRKPGSDGRRKEWLSNWRAAEAFAEEQNKKIEAAMARPPTPSTMPPMRG